MHASRIIENLRKTPFITSSESFIHGALKTTADHFQVEEIMPYVPCGKGEHVYVTLQRSGWNTADVATKIASILKINSRDIGYAGLKDKDALTTQTFSLLLPESVPLKDVENILKEQSSFAILNIQRHGNKIRSGHVRANRFRVVLSGTFSSSDLKCALSIAEEIKASGMPNYFGHQRFGKDYSNIPYAFELFSSNRIRKQRKGKFWMSVVQAALFNFWLMARIERGDFNTVLVGDIAKKTDTGGLFTVTDAAEARERFFRQELTYTGPIYGYKLMAATEKSAEFEWEILKKFDIDPQQFKRMKAPGSRRIGLLWMKDIHIEPVNDGLLFRFELPAGSYATTLMREFIKTAKTSG